MSKFVIVFVLVAIFAIHNTNADLNSSLTTLFKALDRHFGTKSFDTYDSYSNSCNDSAVAAYNSIANDYIIPVRDGRNQISKGEVKAMFKTYRDANPSKTIYQLPLADVLIGWGITE